MEENSSLPKTAGPQVPIAPKAITGWRLVADHPPTDGDDAKSAWGDHVAVLLCSPRLGVVSGTIHRLHGGEPHANVPCCHGNAITAWGVTHWMPLPSPPGEAATVSEGEEQGSTRSGEEPPSSPSRERVEVLEAALRKAADELGLAADKIYRFHGLLSHGLRDAERRARAFLPS